MKKIIETTDAPAAIGPYSQGILVQGWVFISGQIPIEPATNKVISDDIGSQTEQVLSNIKAIIEKAGGTLQNIVKTTIYLKYMDDFARVNEVYKRYFSDSPPARATVQVSRLPKDVKIEIDAIGFIRNSSD
jgi:2-iminobutanoate/2-iminopropanoate deaminase